MRKKRADPHSAGSGFSSRKFFLWEGRVIGEARFVDPETLDGPGERK
jgi:hypothetical protein